MNPCDFFLENWKTCVRVNPQNIFQYFEMLVCSVHAKNLHTHYITAALCYKLSLYREYSQNYQCFCFKCRIYRLLCGTLISRGYTNILYVSRNLELTILLWLDLFYVSFVSFLYFS